MDLIDIAQHLLRFSVVIVLVYLLAYGTMLDDRKTLIPLLLAHLLFVPAFISRLEHWPLGISDVLLIAGILTIGFLYSFHFYKKPEKHIFDWLKLLFVWLVYLASYVIMMGWEYGREMVIFSLVLLLVILGFILYRNLKK